MTPKDQKAAQAQPTDDAEPQGPGLEEAPAGSAALAAIDAPSFALERQPIIDLIPQRQVALLKDRSPGLNHGELASALELAWSYQLDPFANEIWFTKSRGRNGNPGKLLIMVGRDGLRKVAQRNGLEVDCDVVRANDTFRVVRGADRQRVVVHEYEGGDAERGDIVGAWAECYERTGGRQRGFFYAPVGEYRPSNIDAYTPWGKQVSVMTLAAAERQAIRQATPLGGLLVEGEDVLVNEAGEASEATKGQPFDGLPFEGDIEQVVDRARQLGHQGLASVATAQMALQGQPEHRVREWIDAAKAELDQLERPAEDDDVPDADVVEDEPDAGRAAASSATVLDQHSAVAGAGTEPPPEPEPGPVAEADQVERARSLREDADSKRAWAATSEDDAEREQLEAEADALEAEADGLDAGQTDLGL